jgi:hypothetical protein
MESTELPQPDAGDAEVGIPRPTLLPHQMLLFLSPDEWEEFIREWGTALVHDYDSVRRVGGSGDGGRDVAGFLTKDGFDGPWDCFQCKHYKSALNWSSLFPELVKVFRNVAAGEYSLPRKYIVLAPWGVSATLERLIKTPSAMRKKFLEEVEKKLGDDAARSAIVELAAETDFAIFSSADVEEVLRVHATTRFHVRRFGSPLPPRSTPAGPPELIQDSEMTYVEQLLSVYRERWPEIASLDDARREGRTQQNLSRQRIRFFKAESLQAYASNGVLEGTFERFQEEIYSGVVEVVESDHDTGWARLNQVLATAGQLNLTSQLLATKADQDDLKGVCHQLVNDGRICWV